MDGALKGYLDPGCGLILTAPAGRHRISITWSEHLISEDVTVVANEVVCFVIDADLTISPVKPVALDAMNCGA